MAFRIAKRGEVSHWFIDWERGEFELVTVVLDEADGTTRVAGFFVAAKGSPAAEANATAFIQAGELLRGRQP